MPSGSTLTSRSYDCSLSADKNAQIAPSLTNYACSRTNDHVFGPTQETATRRHRNRKLQTEDRHNLFSSLNIVTNTNKWMRSVGHVMCTGEMRSAYRNPHTISVQELWDRPGIPSARSQYNINTSFWRNKTLWCGLDSTFSVWVAMADFANIVMGPVGWIKSCNSWTSGANINFLKSTSWIINITMNYLFWTTSN